MSTELDPALNVILDEFVRWRDADSDGDTAVSIGAVGALANVVAKLWLDKGVGAGQPAVEVPRGSALVPAICDGWGSGWFGLTRIRLMFDEGGEKTFWHFMFLNRFSIGVSLPPLLVNSVSFLKGKIR